MTAASVLATSVAGTNNFGGATRHYLDESRTVRLPNLADLTVQFARPNFALPTAPVAQVWADSTAVERRLWVHYVRNELRAMLYIMTALTVLGSYLLAVAPGPLTSVPSLYIIGALATWLATGWLGIAPPASRGRLWFRRVAMATGWLGGMMLLLAGILLPISQWVSSLLAA